MNFSVKREFNANRDVLSPKLSKSYWWIAEIVRRKCALLMSWCFGFKPPVSKLDGDREIEWSWVEAHLNIGPGNLLDFGCGPRSYLGLTAARRGYQVTAVDLLPAFCPFRFPSLQFLQGDIFYLDFKKQSFDVIIGCSSIEHVGLAGVTEVRIARMVISKQWTY